MTLMVKDNRILLDGVQFGVEYRSHDIAIHQGKKVHEKHYPHAQFVVIPEKK